MVPFWRLMGHGYCSLCYIGKAIGQMLSDLLYTSLVLHRAVSFPLCSSFCILTISSPTNLIVIKLADDTILLSLLSGPSQHHGPTLQEFVEWCDHSCLELNVNKTKEMVVIFFNKQRQMTTAVTTIIQGKPIDIVEEYKYLGTIFENLLPTRRRNLGNSRSTSTF